MTLDELKATLDTFSPAKVAFVADNTLSLFRDYQETVTEISC